MAKYLDLQAPVDAGEKLKQVDLATQELGGHAVDAIFLAPYVDLDGRPSPTENHPGMPGDHHYTPSEILLRKSQGLPITRSN